MTEREKHIHQRRKEIEKISKRQFKLIKQSIAIAQMPAKRWQTSLKRCARIIAIALAVRQLEMQKQLIAAQPIPKFPPGSFAEGGIIGESNQKEVVMLKDGKFQIP